VCYKVVSEHGYNTWPAWAHERVAQRAPFEVLLKGVTPYLNPLIKSQVKNENSYCVCACEKYELCTGYK
jgi:hypothetical protein